MHQPLTGAISVSVNGADAGNVSFSATGDWVGSYNTVDFNGSVPQNATFDIFFDDGDTAMNV